MGEKVVAGPFDLSDRQRVPRQAPAVSDGAGAAAGGEAVRPPQESHGAGDRAESRRARRHAENDECAKCSSASPAGISRRNSACSIWKSTSFRTGSAAGYSTSSPRSCARGSHMPTGRPNEVDAGIVMIGILPTLDRRRPGLREPLRRGPLHAAQRPDRGRPRRGVRARHRGRGAARAAPRRRSPRRRPAPRCSCISRSRPERFADVWNAAQAVAAVQIAVGRQLAVPVRPRAVARVAAPAVPAGHRHPPARSSRRRAYGRGPGSGSAGSRRRTTSSRRTCATSRRCCRSATRRTR